jgi:hypothetical protein
MRHFLSFHHRFPSMFS